MCWSLRFDIKNPRLIHHPSSQYHNESVLKKYSPKLKIGEVKDAAKL